MEILRAINIHDGRIVPFNEEVARQTAYAQIPADLAHEVGVGNVDWHEVVEIIHQKRNNDPNFSWEAFDKLRNQQNIRRAKYDLPGKEESAAQDDGNVKQVDVSLDEVKTKSRGRKAAKASAESAEKAEKTKAPPRTVDLSLEG